MKCPVCGNSSNTMHCLKCGFDQSRNYEKYPSLGPVGKVPSLSARRQEWEHKHPEPMADPVIPPSPEPQPVEPPQKKKPWLTIAACAAMLALGIGIGAGLGGGKPEPKEPKDTVQMQEPVETTTAPPETTADPDSWRNNIMRSDEMTDADGNGYHSMDDARLTPVLGSDYRRNQICSVTFLDTLSEQPDDAWDVSEAGDGLVMAWVKPNNDRYDLYIGAEGGVSAGTSTKDMFYGFENAVYIRFNNAFHTENVQDMNAMFYCCSSLTELTLGDGFDTSNVQDMSQMFLGCGSLTDLILGDGFVTTNADTTNMFLNCPAGADYRHPVH